MHRSEGRDRQLPNVIAQRLSTAIEGVLMAVVILAGAAKAYDPVGFATALATWRYIPFQAITYLAFIVPVIELTLGIAWFAKLNRERVVALVMLLLFVFTVTYAAHYVNGQVVKCSCFGQIGALFDGATDSRIVIVRNSIMLAGFCGSRAMGGIARYQIGRAEGPAAP